MDYRKNFSNNLRSYLLRSNLSQVQLAQALNISTSTLNDWCNGKKYPRIENLDRLSKFFNCSISELTGRQMERSDFSLLARKTEKLSTHQKEKLFQILDATIDEMLNSSSKEE